MNLGMARLRSISGRQVSSQRVEAKWAAWVQSDLGTVRARRPSPMAMISSSQVKGGKVRIGVSGRFIAELGEERAFTEHKKRFIPSMKKPAGLGRVGCGLTPTET